MLKLSTVDGKTSGVESIETRQNGYQWYVALCQTTRFATRIQNINNACPKLRVVFWCLPIVAAEDSSIDERLAKEHPTFSMKVDEPLRP